MSAPLQNFYFQRTKYVLVKGCSVHLGQRWLNFQNVSTHVKCDTQSPLSVHMSICLFICPYIRLYVSPSPHFFFNFLEFLLALVKRFNVPHMREFSRWQHIKVHFGMNKWDPNLIQKFNSHLSNLNFASCFRLPKSISLVFICQTVWGQIEQFFQKF